MLSAAAIPGLLCLFVLFAACYLCLVCPRTPGRRVATILGAALVAILRFSVPGHGFSWAGSYEAIAHIVCGMLLMLAFQKDKIAGWSLAVITVFEGVMFALR